MSGAGVIGPRGLPDVRSRAGLLFRTGVRFRGRYWGKNGHGFLQRKCLLVTHSGHFKVSNFFVQAAVQSFAANRHTLILM